MRKMNKWTFVKIQIALNIILFLLIVGNGVGSDFAQAVSNPEHADRIIKEVNNYYSFGEKGEKGDKGDKGEQGEKGETVIIYQPAPEEEQEPITSMPQPVEPPKNTGEITVNPSQSSSHLILKE